MQKTTLNFAAVIAAALLTACGGHDNGSTGTTLPPADINGSKVSTSGNTHRTPDNQGSTNPGQQNPGGGKKVLHPAPTRPSAAEMAAFNARKTGREKVEGVGHGTTIREHTISVNGHNLIRVMRSGNGYVGEVDFRSLPSGFASYSGTDTDSKGSTKVTVRSYQGFRSGIVAAFDEKNRVVNITPYRDGTPAATMPAAGKATYTGVAFDSIDRGNLAYNVDFGTRTGEGRIEGLSRYGNITLASGKFEQARALDGSTYTAIRDKAQAANGSSLAYTLGFNGRLAEEITGYAVNNDLEGVAFHGTRGAITE